MPRPAGTKPLGVPLIGGSLPSAAIQFSVGLRNYLLDQIEAYVGTNPILRVYSGAKPADLTTSPLGTLLAEITLPSDWMGAATGGVKEIAGSWANTAVGAARVGCWRIYNSADTEAIMQGDATGTGEGGSMEADDPNIEVAQTVTVSVFSLTGGNE